MGKLTPGTAHEPRRAYIPLTSVYRDGCQLSSPAVFKEDVGKSGEQFY